MEPETIEKLLLLVAGVVAGGVMSAVGAWANDWRSERRRKNAKLEDAYLAWLDTQSSVLGRLKALTQSVKKEPDSLQSLELILETFKRLETELQDLNSALNSAFIYERDRTKKSILERQSLLYAHLIADLGTILGFHTKWRQILDALWSTVEKMETIDPQQWQPHDVTKVRDAMAENITELSNLSSSICSFAKRLSEYIEKFEEQSRVIREVLVK